MSELKPSKPYTIIDQIEMNPERVMGLRESVIATRDAALKQGLLDWAFELSLVVAVLQDYIERIQSA